MRLVRSLFFDVLQNSPAVSDFLIRMPQEFAKLPGREAPVTLPTKADTKGGTEDPVQHKYWLFCLVIEGLYEFRIIHHREPDKLMQYCLCFRVQIELTVYFYGQFLVKSLPLLALDHRSPAQIHIGDLSKGRREF